MSSYPTRNRKFQKKAKKIQKIKNHHFGNFSCQNKLGNAEKEKKKKIVPMSSYQTRNRKFQKNSKKIQKFKKHHYGFSSSQNKLGKDEKERKFKKKKKKSFQRVPTGPVIENSKKIEKIFKKFKNTITTSFEAKIGWKRPKKKENK